MMNLHDVAAAARRTSALALLIAIAPLCARAEPAGQVIFSTAGVVAVDAAGARRTLDKGAAVEEGDTLLTGEGRVQVQFKDGGFVALQPQSEFKVERYRYTAAGDTEDGVVMSLLKGGLRTLSGLVGKRDHSAYRMNAVVATIGIRGTDYALELDGGLIGHVTDGAIEVCNGAGCLLVPKGQAFVVPALDQKPTLSERRAFLPPARAGQAGLDETSGKAERANRNTADSSASGSTSGSAGGNRQAGRSADAAGRQPSVEASGPAAPVSRGAIGQAADGLAPGQAKKLDVAATSLTLPGPSANPAGSAAVSASVDATPIGPSGSPPGQAKKSESLEAASVSLPNPIAGASAAPGVAASTSTGVSGTHGPPGGIPPGQVVR